ncbi:MAG: alpha-glucosidase C-terminal domain-containing protein [Ignavibacteriae bacterium]|nr:alpha-glucosidase C-terminal domain-containing protein [Ignavibacteriota bacterium]
MWYQIFPERFRNGDRKNDPTVTDILGSWPHEDPKAWHVSKWTGDWYELQSWEDADNKGFYYRAQQRRYGGDLQGVLDKLDYISDLGITAIYFNPLFESPSLHKYDATLYHHIDNNFGPDPEGDRKIWESEDPADPSTWKWTAADRLFLKLIEEIHKRGMKIIIDGVFNHVGVTFWAFRDVKEKGERSLYKDWFIIKKWDDPSTPQDEFDYAGWSGVRDLPELRENENGLVAGPREHVQHIVNRWMDPNADGDPTDGIDGWRLDVAEMVAIPFWRDFRKWVRAVNPDAYLVGEVWWEDWNNGVMFNAAPWLQGDVFDAVMNYRWARETGRFFKDRKNKISATELDRRLAAIRGDYPEDVNYVLMNLMDSHDTDRLSSQIVNSDTHYDKHVNLNDNPDYDVRKPTVDELRTQQLIALFQMTYVGAPTVYYGTEAGMWGADDPDERKPMLWADMKFDNESHHPFGKARPDDVNEFNADMFQHYKKLISIRRTNPALAIGTYTPLVADDTNDVLAFLSSYESQHIVVVVNNSMMAQSVRVPLNDHLKTLRWKGLLDGIAVDVSGNSLRMTLEAKSGTVIEGEGSL